jgi:GABA(A) receptor-associated protein
MDLVRTVRDTVTRKTTKEPYNSFRAQHVLRKRKEEAGRIRQKYPNRIPVIVTRAINSKIAHIDKQKYLVPADLTIGQLVYVIRKRISLNAERALFVFVNNSLPTTDNLMSDVYQRHKHIDGFLYIEYSGENTFG